MNLLIILIVGIVGTLMALLVARIFSNDSGYTDFPGEFYETEEDDEQ